MFSKPVAELKYSDINDLVNVRNEREGYHLDFKREIGYDDKAKKELSKDISAFANTGGGYLIIGVDKDYKIIGVDKKIQNKDIDEWINQIIGSNTEPQLFYFDPKIIPIPGSEKVIVVIQVPESTKKPHIVTDWNKYHIRINDSSKSANHNNIRDMFEFSKNRTDEFKEFLKNRNLIDEEDSLFGINKNSSKISDVVGAKLDKPKPFILFSFIPKYLDDEKINLPFNEFKSWFDRNSKGYEPIPSQSIFGIGYSCDIKLDGTVFWNERTDINKAYFDILNNGFFEGGFEVPFIDYIANNYENNKLYGCLNLTYVICYEMMLLRFAKEYFKLAKYYDEVFFQISFVNVLGYVLWGLHDMYDIRGFGNPILNTQNNNFKLTYKFHPNKISQDEIFAIAKLHSERICRAFGLDKDYGFVKNEISYGALSYFYL